MAKFVRSATRIVLLVSATAYTAACSDGGGGSSSAAFEPIEPPPGFASLSAFAISGDGGTVVGSVWREPSGEEDSMFAIAWTPEAGIVDLGFAGSASAVSHDGAVIGGSLRDPPVATGELRAFRWSQASGAEVLEQPGYGLSSVAAIDRTGRHLALYAQDLTSGAFASFLWDAEGRGDDRLAPYPPAVPPPVTTFVRALSPDAAIAAGIRRTPAGEDAVVWDAAGVSILPSDGSRNCEPSALSADGRVVAGSCYVQLTANGFVTRVYEAVRWIDGVLHVLEPLPGEAMSFASDVSADGEVIVGAVDVGGGSHTQAMVWRAATGKVLLADLLQDAGLADAIAGWALVQATSVSADGRIVAGNGVGPDGREAAFRVVLPASSD